MRMRRSVTQRRHPIPPLRHRGERDGSRSRSAAPTSRGATCSDLARSESSLGRLGSAAPRADEELDAEADQPDRDQAEDVRRRLPERSAALLRRDRGRSRRQRCLRPTAAAHDLLRERGLPGLVERDPVDLEHAAARRREEELLAVAAELERPLRLHAAHAGHARGPLERRLRPEVGPALIERDVLGHVHEPSVREVRREVRALVLGRDGRGDAAGPRLHHEDAGLRPGRERDLVAARGPCRGGAGEGALLALLARERLGQLLRARAVAADHPQIGHARPIHVEREARAVGAPAREARDAAELRHLRALRAGDVDEPDLALAFGARVDRERLTVGAPRGVAIVRITAGQALRVPAVGVHHPYAVAAITLVALEGDALRVWAERGSEARLRRRGELPDRRGGHRSQAGVHAEHGDGDDHTRRVQRSHLIGRSPSKSAAGPPAVRAGAGRPVTIRTHSRRTRKASAAIARPPKRSASCERIPSFAAVFATNALVTKKYATATLASDHSRATTASATRRSRSRTMRSWSRTFRPMSTIAATCSVDAQKSTGPGTG